MKVSVKTLKGSSFQIEVEATDKVPIARAPDLSCHGSGCWMDWRGCFARFGLLLGSLGARVWRSSVRRRWGRRSPRAKLAWIQSVGCCVNTWILPLIPTREKYRLRKWSVWNTELLQSSLVGLGLGSF
jgi:hypothetical protein